MCVNEVKRGERKGSLSTDRLTEKRAYKFFGWNGRRGMSKLLLGRSDNLRRRRGKHTHTHARTRPLLRLCPVLKGKVASHIAKMDEATSPVKLDRPS